MKIPRYVYAIQHNVTKKIYIGSSYDPELRCRNHLSLLRNGKHGVEDMQEDFDEFGCDYTFYILEKIDNYEDRTKEAMWMDRLKSNIRGRGYNYKDNVRGSESRIPFTDGIPSPADAPDDNG